MRSFLAAMAIACAVGAVSFAGYSAPAMLVEALPNVAVGTDPAPAVLASLTPPTQIIIIESPIVTDGIPFPLSRRKTVEPPPTVLLLAAASHDVSKGPRALGLRRSLWCADAINAWLRRIGVKGTGSPLASSFVHWGKPAKPAPGVIAVKTRRGGNHVVVIKVIKGSTVIAISPNSGGKVREMRYSVRQFYAFRVPA